MTRVLAQAHRYWKQLKAGELDVTTLAAREQVSPSYVTRLLRLAFLAPAVVEAILAGNQRAGVDAAALIATGAIVTHWSKQKRAFLADGS